MLGDSLAIKLQKPSYLELSNVCFGTHMCLEILQKDIINFEPSQSTFWSLSGPEYSKIDKNGVFKGSTMLLLMVNYNI